MFPFNLEIARVSSFGDHERKIERVDIREDLQVSTCRAMFLLCTAPITHVCEDMGLQRVST
jgi:hypothetical protein